MRKDVLVHEHNVRVPYGKFNYSLLCQPLLLEKTEKIAHFKKKNKFKKNVSFAERLLSHSIVCCVVVCK